MSYINKIAFCLICKNELTDWEKQFNDDYNAKILKYGESTNFSDKQKFVIDKIIDKVSNR